MVDIKKITFSFSFQVDFESTKEKLPASVVSYNLFVGMIY